MVYFATFYSLAFYVNAETRLFLPWYLTFEYDARFLPLQKYDGVPQN
jgi:hypothetical protein